MPSPPGPGCAGPGRGAGGVQEARSGNGQTWGQLAASASLAPPVALLQRDRVGGGGHGPRYGLSGPRSRPQTRGRWPALYGTRAGSGAGGLSPLLPAPPAWGGGCSDHGAAWLAAQLALGSRHCLWRLLGNNEVCRVRGSWFTVAQRPTRGVEGSPAPQAAAAVHDRGVPAGQATPLRLPRPEAQALRRASAGTCARAPATWRRLLRNGENPQLGRTSRGKHCACGLARAGHPASDRSLPARTDREAGAGPLQGPPSAPPSRTARAPPSGTRDAPLPSPSPVGSPWEELAGHTPPGSAWLGTRPGRLGQTTEQGSQEGPEGVAGRGSPPRERDSGWLPGHVAGAPGTEGVLQHVGELAVPVGHVASALPQGPEHVPQGCQAPVDAGSLPQGRARHSRYTWDSQGPATL